MVIVQNRSASGSVERFFDGVDAAHVERLGGVESIVGIVAVIAGNEGSADGDEITIPAAGRRCSRGATIAKTKTLIALVSKLAPTTSIVVHRGEAPVVIALD